MACPSAWDTSCPCSACPEVSVEKPGSESEMMLKGCHLDGCWEIHHGLDSYSPVWTGFGRAGSGHVLRGHQTDEMVWVQVSASPPRKKIKTIKGQEPFLTLPTLSIPKGHRTINDWSCTGNISSSKRCLGASNETYCQISGVILQAFTLY